MAGAGLRMVRGARGGDDMADASQGPASPPLRSYRRRYNIRELTTMLFTTTQAIDMGEFSCPPGCQMLMENQSTGRASFYWIAYIPPGEKWGPEEKDWFHCSFNSDRNRDPAVTRRDNRAPSPSPDRNIRGVRALVSEFRARVQCHSFMWEWWMSLPAHRQASLT